MLPWQRHCAMGTPFVTTVGVAHLTKAKRIEYPPLTFQACGGERLPMNTLANP